MSFGSRRYSFQLLKSSHGACHTSLLAGHHAAAMALQAYLHATPVVEKAPDIMKKLVTLIRDWPPEKPAGGSSPAVDIRNEVTANPKDTNVDVLEAALKSFDMQSERALSSEPEDVKALHYLIKKFQKLGVSRRQFDEMLVNGPGILSCTQKDFEVGTRTLRGLGVPLEDVSRLLRMCPLRFSPQFVSNVRCLKKELKAFPAKVEIIRNAVCEVPHKVYEFSEGGSRAVVQCLQGFDLIKGDMDINNLFVKCPRLLLMDVESRLKPNLEFFLSLGFRKQELSKAIFRRPALLLYSLRDNVMVKCDYFKSLGLTNDDLVTVIARYPHIFGASLENKVKPLLNEVCNLGLDGEGPKKVVLYKPSVFSIPLRVDVSTLIEDVKAMDCSEDEKVRAFVRTYRRCPRPEVPNCEI